MPSIAWFWPGAQHCLLYDRWGRGVGHAIWCRGIGRDGRVKGVSCACSFCNTSPPTEGTQTRFSICITFHKTIRRFPKRTSTYPEPHMAYGRLGHPFLPIIRLPDRVTLTLPAADCIGCRWQGILRTSTSLENRPRTLQRLSVPHGLVFSSGFFVCFVFCRNTFVSVRTNFCEYECVNGRTDLDGLDGWIWTCS
jgi:hypothetical protein